MSRRAKEYMDRMDFQVKMRDAGYVSTARLAQELNVSITTIHNWRKEKDGLPYTGSGKSLYYKLSEAKAWAYNRGAGATEKAETAERILKEKYVYSEDDEDSVFTSMIMKTLERERQEKGIEDEEIYKALGKMGCTPVTLYFDGKHIRGWDHIKVKDF